MANAVKILAFSGSARRGSLNKELVNVAAKKAEALGADATLVDLRDYPMPIYDGDLEDAEGLPATAEDLRILFKQQDGFLISSPEYNGGYSALLKNTLDWLSRPYPGDPVLAPFRGKACCLMSASPSGFAGTGGLAQIQPIITKLRMVLHHRTYSLPRAHQYFDGAGNLADPNQSEALGLVVEGAVALSGQVSGKLSN
jgi:chromate reductase